MWKIPPETIRHSKLWLAWPWNSKIWDNIPGTSLRAAQSTCDRLVRTILNYENVSLIVRDEDAVEVERQLKSTTRQRFQIEIVPEIYNDIWVRDTLPTFAISDQGSLVAIDWNFNGWGRRVRPYSPYGDDVQLGRKIATRIGATIIDSTLTAEGGAFAFDQTDSIVATKSVMLDVFRNPNRSKVDIDAAIKRATGRQIVCWLPGDRNEPVTTGHADSILAFASNDKVLFNWSDDEASADHDVCDYNLRVFQEWAKRLGRRYDIIKLPAPTRRAGYGYCSSYINFAHVNDAILVPAFGDRESDQSAQALIRDAFNGIFEIELVAVSAIACAGGNIHCATQHQPSTDAASNPEL